MPDQNVEVAVDIVNKEFNVPLDRNGEIRIGRVSVPPTINAGAAVAFEFGLYYGSGDVPASEWQKYSGFDVPMVITMALPGEIDRSKPVKVYHFADGSSAGEEVYSELTEDGKIMFIADSFSIYTVLNETGETEDPDDHNSGNIGNGNVGTSTSAGNGVTSPRTYDNSTDGNTETGNTGRSILIPASIVVLAAIILFGVRLSRQRKGRDE